MGVPKFFRYMSERYPCLSEFVKEHQLPDYDNMYLDMNGIIHMCSHPDDNNPHFRITEKKIFEEIFHYVAYLFKLIQPKKVFFLAIDGVAPRAKMNQQRGRRFRSAKEAEQMIEEAKKKGEKLPSEERFDSNCITPGTVFMDKLHEQLRYFIKQKISMDNAWSNCRIVLSGHETPGEGEHKIMEYIRYLKAQPDHDPNTRHCLYGLDADLIMLGLCSHEPNFSLLREEVKFGKNQTRSNTPDENNFYLLHLSLMRDYLEQEFLPLKDDLSFGYDLEKVIDDWVLMGFLVGNDFIPPLPHMHIQNDALPLLYNTYKAVLPNLDGYINEGGILKLERFEIFMKKLAEMDIDNFQETYADLKFFEEKTGRKMNENERKSYRHVPDNKDTFGVDIAEIKSQNTKNLSAFQCDLEALIAATDELTTDADGFVTDDDEDVDDLAGDDSSLMHAEFSLHKRDYYITKLKYEKVTPEVLQDQSECYVRAIQWVLHYYYQGCASWSWFYPHHYAPYISDVVNFKNMNLDFDMGTPFKPFEQLLAVLPAGSKELLPEPFHTLMISDTSPIHNYYPVDFETDLNGKRNEWEAVVLIPFIDERNLIGAMEPCYVQLTAAEVKRNTHGPMFIYDYTSENLGNVVAPEYFPTVKECHARETPVAGQELVVPPHKVVRGPLPNPYSHMFFPGIPTLKHIAFTTHFTKAKVKVFEFPARNDNAILNVIHKNESEPPVDQVAGSLLGKVIWVGWPHLCQAKVVSVWNEKFRFTYTANKKEHSSIDDDEVESIAKTSISDAHKQAEFQFHRRSIVEHHMSRLGIDVGEVTTVVSAVNLKGYKYMFGSSGKMVMEAEWCETDSPYPLQCVLPTLPMVAPIYRKRYLTIEEALPAGDSVFILTGPYYGCMAKIVDSSLTAKCGRVKICVTMEPEPVIDYKEMEAIQPHYMTAHVAAARCGINAIILSRLTGCLFVTCVESGKEGKRINIGLNLKFSKKNEEIVGYTHKVDDRWQYSQKCVELVCAYIKEFEEMFQRLSKMINQDNFHERDLFPDNIGEMKVQEVSTWVKLQPFNDNSVRSCDSQSLEPEELEYVRDSLDRQVPDLVEQRTKQGLQVKPHVLYKPDMSSGNIPPDRGADYKLLDRVINVNPLCSVPLGLKGTVTGISKQKPSSATVKLSDKLNLENVYQILFDASFLGGVNVDGITGNRMYKMMGFNLLNITYGRASFGNLDTKVQPNTKPASQDQNMDSFKILRANGTHNSAFANYTSPTKNHLEIFAPSFLPSPAKANNGEKQAPSQPQKDDSSTLFLKSLLKISETKSPGVQPERPGPVIPSVVPMSFPGRPNIPPAPCAQPNYLQSVFPNNQTADSLQHSGGMYVNNAQYPRPLMMNNQQSPMMNNQPSPMMNNQQSPMMNNQQSPMMNNQQSPMMNNQQPPMMLNSQQPQMMNIHQHQMMINQQPPVMLNQMPMMNNQQPPMMNNQQPLMMNNQQPLMMNNHLTQMMNNQQPPMMNQQQMIMMNQQPMMNQDSPMMMNPLPPMMNNQNLPMVNNPQFRSPQMPPSNHQLPFPQKLLDKPMLPNSPKHVQPMTDKQRQPRENSGNKILGNPFVPLQAVTRQRNNSSSSNQKNYRKGFHETKVVHTEADKNKPAQLEKNQTLPNSAEVSESNNTKTKASKKKKKSRIAANFGPM